ncbi:ATP-binding cassette, subfamily B [Ligilactobacillus sp. WC1T17]|uniref:ATP-binding cassette, subfamily B n=1 Tax=Ligilactobacillus ruminis TaxID=1623 RepID=A0ABY1ADH9_9LACO|nr:ATP-binding cassette, subfamily B [Ligilactobacillus ruminis]
MNIVKTLARSIREYKKASILAPIMVSGEVIMEVLIPLLMAKLIDHMGGDLGPIMYYGFILFILAIFSLLFGAGAARQASKGSCGLAKNLRQDIFERVQHFSFPDIDYFSAASLVTRMTTDVTNVQNAYSMLIRAAFRAPLMIIFSVIMALTINWKMALIFLAMLPILAIVIFGIAFKVHPIFVRIFRKYDAMNDGVEENIRGMRVVKSFVREDYEKKKFYQETETVRQDFTHAEKILAWNSPVMMTCIFASITLISYFGARLIITTHATSLTTGALSSLINYGVQILAAVMILSMVFTLCWISEESAERITEVLTYEPTITSPANGVKEVKDGSIDFNHVSFKYSPHSKKEALVDIDLHIPSGATIGIIGGTGSSKTTLVQLISRLYDVTEGELKVGGVNVKDYDLEPLRDQVAMVLQKNVLFRGTISENLRWGNPNASDEEILHAAKLAQADEFVQAFPDKYETMISQGGTNVSGGQKQRLCIARALLKKPKILILDDSTSAVDTKTDALIRKAFQEEIPDTTKIIIAQRVSSVEDADQILVMDGGRIVEQGTSEELLALNGIYREVYDSQTQNMQQKEA